MKIVALGDSLTYGYGVKRNLSWCVISSKQMEREVVCRGINGDTTSGMLARFDRDVLSEKPGYVIITGGTNDIIVSGDIQTTKCNITAMVYQAKARNIISVLGTPLPFHIKSLPSKWSDFIDFASLKPVFEKYIKWLYWFGRTYKTDIIDFWTPFFEDSVNDGKFYFDGLHPNADGQLLIADAVIKYFGGKL